MSTKTKPTFADLLQRFREAKGIRSVYRLAQRARLFGKISTSYLVRLEQGARNPSREKVLILAKALALSPKETDQLLVSAGHVPLSQWGDTVPALENPAIRAVLNLLDDPKIPLKRKLKAEETIASFVTWLHSELTSSEASGRAVRAGRGRTRRSAKRS